MSRMDNSKMTYAVTGNCIYLSDSETEKSVFIIPFDKVTYLEWQDDTVLIHVGGVQQAIKVSGASDVKELKQFFIGLTQQYLKFKDPSYEAPTKKPQILTFNCRTETGGKAGATLALKNIEKIQYFEENDKVTFKVWDKFSGGPTYYYFETAEECAEIIRQCVGNTDFMKCS
jgi:hypothetical protein